MKLKIVIIGLLSLFVLGSCGVSREIKEEKARERAKEKDAQTTSNRDKFKSTFDAEINK